MLESSHYSKTLHSLANYPTTFKGTVISPTKICMQFSDVEVKLRKNLESTEGLLKQIDNILALPIRVTGSPVAGVAVGCQLPVLEALQQALIDAYVHYGNLHSDRYRKEYGKEFMDFLLNTQTQLNTAIDKLKVGEACL